ncbi:MAG TPA: cytochrome c oxidase assembly protein [Gammaproteobacteria bacterium]|nr:cytochrome c oxidase assembly protein [Gammaproteobacteria bacterium]
MSGEMNAAILLPYEFSPIVLILCLAAVALYLRGVAVRSGVGDAPAWPRSLAFLLGVALMYGVLQTHYDYMAQHMFFLHRLQHLMLHHLAPFLIIIAMPGATLAAGLPERLRGPLRTLGRWPPLRHGYRAIQQPAVAAVLFVGLIYLWLMPGIHFYAMLNVPLYNVMNWSMAVDGLLFWYVMLDPRTPAEGGLRYGWRLLILGLVILPQNAIGGYIAMSDHEIYHVYAICGRLWPISPLADQRIGGLITWIPAAMMSAIGGIVVLRRWMHDENEDRTPAHAVKPKKEEEHAYA